MGISAFTRDKLPMDAICVCGGGICRCDTDFVETIDPDWTDHFVDPWDAIRFYRDGMSCEEWNTAVDDWREECGK